MSTARKTTAQAQPAFQHVNNNAGFGAAQAQQWPTNENKDLIMQDAVLSQKSAKNLGQAPKAKANRLPVEARTQSRRPHQQLNEAFPASDYVDETPVKQGGILTSDISTLKKQPTKDSDDNLRSHEKLGANEDVGYPSQQTSMHEDSSMKPVEQVVSYPLNARENVKIDMLLAGGPREERLDTHMIITENERYQDTATGVDYMPASTGEPSRVRPHAIARKMATPAGNPITQQNTSLEEVVTNSTDDRLQQDVRFMNQIGEELGQLSYPLAPTPKLTSPTHAAHIIEQSARGTVYKLDLKGVQDQKNKPPKQSKLQMRLDQLRKKRNKRKKAENLSIQNSKLENVTTPRGGKSSIQESLMQSSRINPDEFNQHVNKRFAKSFGNYQNDHKKKLKAPGKILVLNNNKQQDETANGSEKSRLSYPVSSAQYQNVPGFLEDPSNLSSALGSPTASGVSKKPGPNVNFGRLMNCQDKLFGQFVQRIQGQQPVPTIVVGQVMKRISP